MSGRILKFTAIALGAAMLASPAAAQYRGTMEFGGFGSAASFDRELTLTSAYGGGGRIGMYLDPRWAIEFEDAEMKAKRTEGLKAVNVGILSGRLVFAPAKVGPLTLLIGAGAGVSTETNFMHTYGVDALAGVKLGISQNMSLRLDGVYDWLANEDWKTYRSVRLGLSIYRHPNSRTQTVTVTEPGVVTTTVVHQDSVSAAEIRRLRASDAALRALRDSLRNSGGSTADDATMRASINFEFDQSTLTPAARQLLDEKLAVFRGDPAMAIAIVGYADSAGTDAYNMALGHRRADAAKAYLVSRGIDASRIMTDSQGQRQPANTGSNAQAQADNRRAVFSLIISPD
jgi:outer membrane protein OmpA-like peptidoglycan-associated protein